jgi:hypothetical protein
MMIVGSLVENKKCRLEKQHLKDLTGWAPNESFIHRSSKTGVNTLLEQNQCFFNRYWIHLKNKNPYIMITSSI